MASTYSPSLGLELPGTGDQAGTWGITTNTNLGTLVEQAISGYVTQAVSTGGDTTITIPNGADGVARNMYIELTGTGGASTNLIVPANKKLYFIFNNTASGQVTVKVSGQTGVSVPNKAKMILVSNGTDIVDATNYVGNLSAASATITNLSSSSATITNLISTTASVSDLSATVTRSASATITNLLATSATITTLTNNPTFGGGTANGVLYLDGSKVATSGSALVFDGTNLGIGTSSPGYKLDVVGGTRVAETAEQNGYEVAPGSTNIITSYNRTTSTWLPLRQRASSHEFYCDGVETLRLTSSGNLGLGVTPSASSYKNFQINTTGIIGSTAGYVWFGNNWVYNGGDKYIANGYATLYGSNEGKHTWFTAPSGTAGNTITFTQAMTLDASSQLMLGTTTALGRVTTAGSGDQSIWFTHTDNVPGRSVTIRLGNNNGTYKTYSPYVQGIVGNGIDNYSLAFGTSSATSGGAVERARITSGGDWFVNATALGNDKNYFAFSPGNATGEFGHETGVASGIAYVNFRYAGTTIGSITQNGTTAVAYNTTSDRRLKNNIVSAPDAGAKIDAIEIVSHDWKSAPDEHVEFGVIAQDLALVAPQAVTAGDDGEEIEKPWGVDYSKLVPMLVKEIQSLRQRVAALEAA